MRVEKGGVEKGGVQTGDNRIMRVSHRHPADEWSFMADHGLCLFSGVHRMVFSDHRSLTEERKTGGGAGLCVPLCPLW